MSQQARDNTALLMDALHRDPATRAQRRLGRTVRRELTVTRKGRRVILVLLALMLVYNSLVGATS